MLAEIIAVGSEMLTPHRQDTNSLTLTAGLNDLGVTVAFKTIVGDNREHLTDAIRIALHRADIVLLSGGLGPTEDDLTRECAAAALGLKLQPDAAVLASLQARFKARKIAMPPNNRKQADVIEGAQVLPNRNGSAPGQWLDTTFPGALGQHFRKLVILLPGPPKELSALFDDECRPRLAAILPARHLARRTLRMALIPESTVDARCAPIYQKFTDVETTILAGSAEIQLHFLCTKETLVEAEARVNEVAELVEHEMADEIFSANGDSLEEVVLLMLDMKGLTLAVAESCTGGWLGQRLTSVPNSSRVFLGGAICYSNSAKTGVRRRPRRSTGKRRRRQREGRPRPRRRNPQPHRRVTRSEHHRHRRPVRAHRTRRRQTRRPRLYRFGGRRRHPGPQAADPRRPRTRPPVGHAARAGDDPPQPAIGQTPNSHTHHSKLNKNPLRTSRKHGVHCVRFLPIHPPATSRCYTHPRRP